MYPSFAKHNAHSLLKPILPTQNYDNDDPESYAFEVRRFVVYAFKGDHITDVEKLQNIRTRRFWKKIAYLKMPFCF